ncbi:hypothetical protein KHA93_19250 [Bacillus sp. FJAT-49732]|uniref:Uncharacterized protein n=1 Tax=Lederbergia citrisecunda TaxID=2833583 RepID=A0A942TT70_9BACI|nr:hypothetical protein [Lederbergia citrisecunda]MBS4201744.1 hypothetical protein [Lederbergia citrisecunda]
MVWGVFAFIAIYSLLTIFAGYTQLKERGFTLRSLMFIIVSITLFLSLFISKKEMMLSVMIVSFIGLHILSIMQGLVVNGKIKYSHHFIRLVFHSFVILLLVLFI